MVISKNKFNELYEKIIALELQNASLQENIERINEQFENFAETIAKRFVEVSSKTDKSVRKAVEVIENNLQKQIDDITKAYNLVAEQVTANRNQIQFGQNIKGSTPSEKIIRDWRPGWKKIDKKGTES